MFVGREKEFRRISQLLANSKGKWLVHVTGEGGIGKTRFLQVLRERFCDQAAASELRCSEIIDFYKPSNQTPFGLLNEIARQLGVKQFAGFEEQRKNYDKVLQQQPDPPLQIEAFDRVAEAFFTDLQALLAGGRRVVLLFDTCEESQAISRWIGWKMLHRIDQIVKELSRATATPDASAPAPPAQPAFVAVFAGRPPFPPPKGLEKSAIELGLAPLSDAEVADFFKQAGLYPGKINKKQMGELAARCGGRPLYVALSHDWLANGMGTIDELLGNGTPFGRKLVDWILRLRERQSDVILASALAWRRTEAGLLTTLMGIPEAQSASLFDALSAYCFVKYRPPEPRHRFSGSFQLHDVMRDLVNEHLWPKEGRWTREAMLDEVLAWYDRRIGKPEVIVGDARPKKDEERSLLAEYLYYRLQKDLIDGSRYGETLFKKANYFIDLSLCDLYNAEISRFARELPDDRLDQLRFQQALVAFRRDDYKEARKLWQSLVRRLNQDEKLYATSHLMLLELEGYAGKFEQALEHANSAEPCYERLLQQPEPAPGFHDLINKELGQLYNNCGYLHRAISNWDEAIRLYKKALNYFRSPKHMARTLNNIGFVYFKKNEIDQALTYVRKALRERERLGIPYELGLGYNTFGMLIESLGRIGDADNLYKKAKSHFEISYSERGLALAHINLGRLARMTNEFDKALNYLEQAERVLEQKNDLTYLIVALNEIGCAYRQRGGPKDREKAERYLNRSLALSQEIGDRKFEAENLEDLSILYYDWAKAVKLRDAGAASKYLDKTLSKTQLAASIAKEQNLPFLLAKVAQTEGEIDFEHHRYDKAFDNLFRACELISGKDGDMPLSTIEYHRRLADIADRMQERLQALPDASATQTYTTRLLEKIAAEPEPIRRNLKMVETKLKATLELNHMIPLPVK